MDTLASRSARLPSPRLLCGPSRLYLPVVHASCQSRRIPVGPAAWDGGQNRVRVRRGRRPGVRSRLPGHSRGGGQQPRAPATSGASTWPAARRGRSRLRRVAGRRGCGRAAHPQRPVLRPGRPAAGVRRLCGGRGPRGASPSARSSAASRRRLHAPPLSSLLSPPSHRLAHSSSSLLAPREWAATRPTCCSAAVSAGCAS